MKRKKNIISQRAPILLFVHKRLKTLKKVIKSLKKNKYFYLHELFIFSDGPKNKAEKKQIQKVRNYLKTIKGFKNIKIFIRKKNIGLADNIITGVSSIIKIKKKVIVIEDDLLLSKNFLEYMNNALKKYKNKKKIWHISGWNWNMNFPKTDYDCFFMRYATCWGWGTWNDRWCYFEKKPSDLIKKFKDFEIKRFNLDNSYNFWSQVIRNKNKTIKTWAIFWYATIFKKKGLSLNPLNSLVLNIGDDSYATNTLYKINKNFFFNDKLPNKYPKKIVEDKILLNFIKFQLKPTLIKKIFQNFSKLSI